MTDRSTPPTALPYSRVDLTWAVSVAEHLLWTYRGLLDPSMVIDDCWVTDEFALYIRHIRNGHRLGVRFGRLDINPTTETTPVDSAQEGIYLYHSIYDTPPERKLTDRLGYGWWGDDPRGADWPRAIEHARARTLTVPSGTAGH